MSGSGPMHNANKLKLGIFSANCSSGMAVTKVEERWRNTWENNIDLVKQCDEAGLEFMLPIARWIGYGGDTDFHGGVLETVTWATGLTALTRNIQIFATVHTAFNHPIVTAKQLATIDQLGGGARLAVDDLHRDTAPRQLEGCEQPHRPRSEDDDVVTGL